jgi:TPR repeat protein
VAPPSKAAVIFEEAMRLHSEARDPGRAVRLLRQASDLGHGDAAFMYGEYLRDGRGTGADGAGALAQYRLAESRGCASGTAGIAICLILGLGGIGVDDARGAEMARGCAEAGSGAGLRVYGWCLRNGRGVARDEEGAYAVYRAAMEAGDVRAMGSLGYMRWVGQGAPRDREMAVRLWRSAGEHGDAEAMFNLGCALRDGDGAGRGLVEAAGWFEKAAGLGYVQAMYELGRCYELGEGKTCSAAQAGIWYRASARAGDEDARRACRRLNLEW